ncbi:aldehyde dehydrogenase family protein [Pseudomonas gingeri]|uniref:Aldehyde dehydrogenase family protein n=1 Tax=Pseudomonas gingeri TaxID=117681 RepID=A0A7Y8CM80_9PSED|nr:aldehyde dehydrogenase family protein [Pseudomonas gingeri]NWA00165.1 aldehyde dehydrogenase family protein [Pseudomonas gingeri]NWA15761.1 aldehyde dehydrogenase family protein [Pseudomonas gingeri]NWA56231.1 aldehyde dehydrogenase family protein [Pseudomonas gingeri]NWA97364.1 aldehyde dehydrogenase family protein [Pseudomonas gingeri]NWB05056.1 aldehyde dehydrogenase family protein [Pseudomonas gingeri]
MRDQHYINGEWVSPDLGGYLPVIDPATGQAFQKIAAGTEEDVDHAVRAARRAFDGGWSQTTGAERAQWLEALADDLEGSQQALAELEVRDNGKPLPEALWDVGDTIGCFRYYAGLARELDQRQDQPLALADARFRCRIRHEPIGVAGQIIPWNYPLLMAAWKVAPALAAGATSVLKPSELTSLTALELAAAADRIGLPAGVLNVVTGLGADAGSPLTEHPGVDKLAFTGSVPTGARIMSAAARDIKNISLELGGKSAFIVFDDADIEAAVEWILFGIFWNQGQVCSATSRLLVQEQIAPRLIERLVEATRKIPIGPGLEPGVLLGPLVSQGQHEKVLGFIDQGQASGARLLTGGRRPAALEHGYFIEPAIFDEPDHNSIVWREEIFGPVLCIKRFKTEEQALHMANASRFGLAAAVMSADLQRAARVANQLRAGIIWVNCSQPTFVEAPWGGMKHSGIGRELGQWGLNNYLEVKQVTEYVSDQPWGWYLK